MPSPESILSKFSSLAACSSPQGSTSPLNLQLNMFSPISTIPEELLERILTFSIQFTSCDISPPSPLTVIAPRVSPLLVCKLWLRVGTPVYFHSITLATPEQTTRLVSLLNEQPQLGSFVRELKVEGIFPQVLDVMRCLRAARSDQTISLRKLDLQLDGPTSMPDVESFCDALDCVANVQQFVVRKPSSVYLTQPGVMLAMKHISEGFERWSDLTSVDLAFRFSPIGCSTSNIQSHPSSPQLTSAVSSDQHPSAMIVSALAKAPKLRVVKTELPTVWNEALLQISSNSSLAEIQLSNSCQPPQTPRFRILPSDRSEYQRPTSVVPSRLPLSSILPISSLYMRIAKNHTRLMDLIHAGSEIVTSDSAFFREPRQRAWTIIPSSPIASGHSQSTSKVTCPKDEEAEQTENESGGSQSSNTRLGVRREVRKGERRMSAV